MSGRTEGAGSRRKGRQGEKRVAGILAELPGDRYRVLNDLFLRTKHGTSQIDHAVISENGIFVIETKNYCGTVTGKDRDREWIQHIPPDEHTGFPGRDRSFYNPVRQNFTHIQALMQLLKPVAGNVPMISIVVFPEGTNLDIHTRSRVMRYDEVRDEIMSHTARIISREKAAMIADFLKNADIKNEEERRRHALNVEQVEQENARINAGRFG